MKKRLFAMLLTVVMMLGCFGVQVFAADLTWETLPDLPKEDRTMTAQIIDNKLYVLGRYND